MSKLTWEFTENSDAIIVRKKKGRITMQEIVDFMHEDNQVRWFDGKLMVMMFRVRSDADRFPFGMDEEPEGDAQTVYVLGDDTECPICGKHGIILQYCPDCGKKLF